jgi:hypothetical protein
MGGDVNIGEEGSKENLVGLDVGDRALFVQVSPGLYHLFWYPYLFQIQFGMYSSIGFGFRTDKKFLDAPFS